MKELEVGGHVKMKDPEHWTFLGFDTFIDGAKAHNNMNCDGEMNCLLGTVVEVVSIIGNTFTSTANDPKHPERTWYWDIRGIEKIVTRQENPEYFI